MEDHGATDALALFQQGIQFLAAGATPAAKDAFRQALCLNPAFAQAHGNLGYALEQEGALSEAEACYRKALNLDAAIPTLHLNLGAVLVRQKRHQEAEASYAAALALEPKSSAVWCNLGALNLNLKNDARAEACLRHAIALDPTNAKARFNLATLRLRKGYFEEGWALFEARDWYRGLERMLTCSRWQGEALAGKSVLVSYEAGHGDVIQFCRYIPLLKAQGAANVTLLCHPPLKTLLQSLAGVDAVCAFNETLVLGDFDYWLPLMSAPYHFGTRVDSVPDRLPYLHASPQHLDHWSNRMEAAHSVTRIGLAWKGNPNFENDQDRSLPHLQILAKLWAVAGIQWISLQKGAGEEDIAECKAQPLTDLGSIMQDFADAAAIISHLDLVITVDTAMAHLAGALGKPCWLLLPWYMTDWRWGDVGSESIWYPQVMRIFRQGPDCDWEPVVKEIVLALSERIAASQDSSN